MPMNHYGICLVSLIPVRKEPSERSEMVSQLLCGETYKLIDIQENWSFIRIHADQYEGWINNKMIDGLEDERHQFILQQPHYVLKEAAWKVETHSGADITWLPGGSIFIAENDILTLGKHPILHIPHVSVYHPCMAQSIPTDALKYMHSPYLWGGKTVFGIDCSGFTQVVFKMNGIALPRDAWQQAEKGTLIPHGDAIQAGDLAFFKREDGYIVHTGIMLDANTIIHASGKVRIDKMNVKGIIHTEDGKYSHQLSHLRRLTDTISIK